MISNRAANLEPSPTLSLDATVKELQRSGVQIFNFALGEPDFETPEVIKQAGVRSIKDGFTHYTPSAGIVDLRQVIIDFYANTYNLEYDLSQVIVGVGSKQLLYTAFQTLCNPEDEVLVATPTWSTYIEQIKLADAKPVLMPLNSPFKLTAADVKSHITKHTKVLLLNSPSNPTGAMIDPEEIEKIARLAHEHNLYIISDEIYDQITYGKKHVSITTISEEAKKRTILINGFSKAYAMTGWRVGYALGPAELIRPMISLSGQTTSGTSSISQKAATVAFGVSDEVRQMVKEFKQRRDFVYRELKQIKGIELHEPEGAFYMFPSVKKLLGNRYKTSSEWAQGLLEEAHVAVVPGEAFYAPGFIRISFAASMDELKAGVTQIKRFIDHQ